MVLPSMRMAPLVDVPLSPEINAESEMVIIGGVAEVELDQMALFDAPEVVFSTRPPEILTATPAPVATIAAP